MKTFELRQERNFGAKISGAFEFIKQNFAGLGKPMLYVALPVGLLAGYFLSGYFSVIFSSLQRTYNSGVEEVFSGVILNYSGMLVSFMIGYALIFCTIFSYIALYDENKERVISLSMVFGKLRKRFWRFLGYNLIYGLLSIVIFIVLIAICVIFPIFLMTQTFVFGTILYLLLLGAFVLFILFFVSFFYVLQNTIFFENLSVGKTISRAFSLMKDHWWETLGLMLVVSLIMNVISLIFIIPLYILLFMNMIGVELEETGKILTIAVSMLSTFGSFMIMPLMQIPMSIQYFHLVEKKDGIGLIGQIDQIGRISDNRDEDDDTE